MLSLVLHVYIHQYAITGLNFSSSFARAAKRDMSAFLNGAGNGVVMVRDVFRVLEK